MAEMIKCYYGSKFGNYLTRTFNDVWKNASDFLSDVKGSGIPSLISDASINTLYYLLYAQYGNSHIANTDETQFKYSVFKIIFQYGIAWEKRLQIQVKLRDIDLTTDNWLVGNTVINNTAQHPGQEPGTDTDTELPYIDSQNTTKTKKGKLEGYSLLMSLIQTDVTKEFIDRFKKLFLQIAIPQRDLWYESEGEEE